MGGKHSKTRDVKKKMKKKSNPDLTGGGNSNYIAHPSFIQANTAPQ